MANLRGSRVAVALGSHLRGNDGRRRPGVTVRGKLAWVACRGCAGFPPSRERREAATRGYGSWQTCVGRVSRLRWVPTFAGATGGGDQGLRFVANLAAVRVAVALGSRLRRPLHNLICWDSMALSTEM